MDRLHVGKEASLGLDLRDLRGAAEVGEVPVAVVNAEVRRENRRLTDDPDEAFPDQGVEAAIPVGPRWRAAGTLQGRQPVLRGPARHGVGHPATAATRAGANPTA